MQLELDLDYREQVRFIYPNCPLTGAIGRLEKTIGRIAFVYFAEAGKILMVYETNLDYLAPAISPTGRRCGNV